ncbi:phospholipase D family protein [Mucilaginibacter gossypii]|uniref:HKD family nuclease n=1 Tax=Mucilaginibacter gossypii TaxID=551996 RepID=A0A1G8CWG5_9SPHI|nr:phospholipase D family protein [Mucilaginibacter gossypii]SDH49816.1 HKD family nuclease [Mucilaginibacter gossypii]
MITHRYNLANDFKNSLADCDELWVAAALVSTDGLDFIQTHLSNEAKQHYLVGIDLPTPPKVLRSLMELSGENFKAHIYQKENRFYHPKVYILRNHKGLTVYTGSGNCTLGGFEKNVEVSLKTDDPITCDELLKWFNIQMKQGKAITEELIKAYEPVFTRRKERMKQDQKEMAQLLSPGTVNLDDINFNGQFFEKTHYNAFTGAKPYSYEPEIDKEREAVRNKLFQLHHLVYPKIKEKNWDLHDHYEFEHTVSSAVHNNYTSEDLDGIWLHYGRGRQEIKAYGKDETPINFMRMQVIIHRDSVGIWNRIGRDKNGSKIDRDHLQELLEKTEFRQKFFQHIHGLPEGYFIIINNRPPKYVNEFTDTEALMDYIVPDDRRYYFFVGKNFGPGDPQLSKANIVSTIMDNFGALYPGYQMILHRMRL